MSTNGTEVASAAAEAGLVAGAARPRRVFFAASCLLFVACATATVLWGRSMPEMSGMSMSGGGMDMLQPEWTMDLLPFLGMWTVMMTAMMAPSIAPAIWRYEKTVGGSDGGRLARSTAAAGAGYLAVWAMLGLAAYPASLAWDATEPGLPAGAAAGVTGLVLLGAGALQFTRWRAHQLTCVRNAPDHAVVDRDGGGPGIRAAWRHGGRLALHCARCSAGPLAVLLVIGVMDLRAMVIVTVWITLERLVPAGERVARSIGVVTIVAGLLLIARV